MTESPLGNEVDYQIQPGPCQFCGGTNYPLSMGGPDTCPACDCGGNAEARAALAELKIAVLRQVLEEQKKTTAAWADLLKEMSQAVKELSEWFEEQHDKKDLESNKGYQSCVYILDQYRNRKNKE